MIEKLTQLCNATNRIGQQLTGTRDNCILACILASAALWEVLQKLGISSYPMRAEAAVFGADINPPEQRYGVILGSDGNGTRRRAASPGKWWGHLIVIAADQYLLDPTLDQVNKIHSWLVAEPFVSAVTPEFLRGDKSLFATTGERASIVRYTAFPGRGGWRSAGDFRPSRRRELVRRVLLFTKKL